MPVHDALTGADAIHPAAYVGATDPALVTANYVGALKWWLDTSGAAPVLKYRDPTNTSWIAVTVGDHGALGGLGDDDHPQYLKVALVDAKGDLLAATGPDAVGKLTLGTNGRVLAADNTQATGLAWIDLPASVTSQYGALEFTFGDGVSAITTAEPAQWIEVPFACTITQATLTADAAGSVVVDVQVADYAAYPPTAAQSICGAAKPTLASALKSQDTTLTGWTPAVARGRYMRCVVSSATTVKRVLLSLAVTA